ncbi:HAD family hydrolase [Brevibacterium sp.]|uniref:HAD family hydrolase n=1 Tax=Brevibacterium sp. TaxID=1701 RepID=UPI002810AA41|nr:HAD family hydrolase [Brevibacterium sp.]
MPYNGDPSLVTVKGEAARALDLVRERGIPVGVISNQSGVGRGLITAAQVTAVNARVAELLGPFDVWCWCPHVSDDGCECRKPQPGMLLAAAGELGVDVTETVMIGDIAADMAAAKAAGARGILVPTARTLNPEIAAAAEVASDLVEAVEMALTPERRAG